MPAGTGQPPPTAAAATPGACGMVQARGSEPGEPPSGAALPAPLCARQPVRNPAQGQGSGPADPACDSEQVAALGREEHGHSAPRFGCAAPPLERGDAGPAPGIGSPGLGSDGGAAPGAAAQGSVVLHAGIPSLLPALYDSDASPDASPMSSPGPRPQLHAGREADSAPWTQAGAAVRLARQAPVLAAAGGTDEEPSAWMNSGPARGGDHGAAASPSCQAAAAWCDGAPAPASASPAPALPSAVLSEAAAFGLWRGDNGAEAGVAGPEASAQQRFDACSPPPEDLAGCEWGEGGFGSPQPAAALQVRARSACHTLLSGLCVCSSAADVISHSWLSFLASFVLSRSCPLGVIYTHNTFTCMCDTMHAHLWLSHPLLPGR